MSEYQNQDIDFINRTLCLIEQYEKIQIQKEEKYETTLFVNCMLGLLIIPKQKLFKKLDEIKDPIEKWGIEQSQIIYPCDIQKIAIILKHLRNSISHYRFSFYYNKGEIDRIYFYDKKNNKCNFKAIIPISNLRTFIDNLIKYYLQEMEQSTNFGK